MRGPVRIREYRLKAKAYETWLLLNFEVEEESLDIIAFEPYLPEAVANDLAEFIAWYVACCLLLHFQEIYSAMIVLSFDYFIKLIYLCVLFISIFSLEACDRVAHCSSF
jgi:hypothetical protein